MKKIILVLFLSILFANRSIAAGPRFVVIYPTEYGNIEQELLDYLQERSGNSLSYHIMSEYLENEQLPDRMPDFTITVYRGEIRIHCLNTDRWATTTFQMEGAAGQERASLLGEKILAGMKFADKLSEPYKLGKILNLNNNIIQYAFKTVSGENLLMEFDFDNFNKELQQVKIRPAEKKANGVYIYELESDQGVKIEIKFSINGSEVNSLISFPGYRVPIVSGYGEIKNNFSVYSTDGAKIIFETGWALRDNHLQGIRIFPEDNPFATIKY